MLMILQEGQEEVEEILLRLSWCKVTRLEYWRNTIKILKKFCLDYPRVSLQSRVRSPSWFLRSSEGWGNPVSGLPWIKVRSLGQNYVTKLEYSLEEAEVIHIPGNKFFNLE